MKRLSPGVRFLLGFITFLLCVVLFVTATAGILVSNVVQVLSSQDNLENLLRQILFVDMLHPASTHNAPIGSAPALRPAPVKTLSPASIRLNKQQTATSMVEWIYQELASDFGDQLQVDLSTIKGFVERSTLDDFLVEKGAGLLNDVYTGQSTVTLSPEEIKTQIEENAVLIEEVFGVPVNMELVSNVTSIIENNEYVARLEEEGIVNILLNLSGDNLSGPLDNPEIQKTQQTIESIRSVLSMQTVLACVAACLVLIVLILLVNIKQIWVGMNKSGITLMLAALPSVAVTVAVLVAPAGWSANLGVPSLVEILAREIVNINASICLGAFAFGLVLLILGIIIFCIAKGAGKKAAALETIENAVIAEAPLAEVNFPAEEDIAESKDEGEEIIAEAEFGEDDADAKPAEEETV